ncbi:MAG: GNAT family N-acetyltransferase, partial [Bacteroidia bacterium]|nr:GNAT family N-acetyltransferase [Bacteroidia bacterium]
GEWVQFAIEEIESGKLIGDIGLKPELYDYRVVEFGISIAKNYSFKGLAKDAVVGAMEFLFKEKNIHRLIGIANCENENSINLLKRLGFRKEAHFKKSYCINEVWTDEYLFALLKEEWIDF